MCVCVCVCVCVCLSACVYLQVGMLVLRCISCQLVGVCGVIHIAQRGGSDGEFLFSLSCFRLLFSFILVKETHLCPEAVSVIAMCVFVFMLFPCIAHAIVMIRGILNDASEITCIPSYFPR